MAGTIKSMVKLANRAIKFTINHLVLTEVTLFSEIESIINNCPLTPLTGDPNNLETQTPNHILIGQPVTNTDIFATNENQVSNRAKWKMVQAFTTIFWKRFITEYIPSLTV